MPSVLFVCTANQYRSPVAAACFHKLLQHQHAELGWRVGSAGAWTFSEQPVLPEAVQNAFLLGLKIESHRTQVVEQDLLKNYDLILVMEKGHKEAIGIEFPFTRQHIYLLSEMVDGIPFDIPDPFSSPGNTFQILNDMCGLIQQGFPRIKQLAEELSRQRT